jgi:ATP-dependent protease ClpP protease subunit
MAKKILHAGEINHDLVEKVYKGGWSELVLLSDGGCTYCMRAICDHLLSHDKRVLVVGQCMSSATAIVACGAPAVCSENCRFLVHKTHMVEASGGIQEMKNNAEELRIESEWYFELLERRTKTTQEVWRDLCREETCFGATVALELGLVDEIV